MSVAFPSRSKQAADRNAALFVPFLIAFGLLGIVMAMRPRLRAGRAGHAAGGRDRAADRPDPRQHTAGTMKKRADGGRAVRTALPALLDQ